MNDSKAIVNMTDWQLYVYKDRYSLSGTADNHPSLGKNTYVSQTSSLVSYTYENEILTYETRNTIYVCPLKYLLPITMKIEDIEYNGYLATLYPVAVFTKEVFEVAYKISRPCWYHFVKLTNSKAKELLKFAINVKMNFDYLPENIDKEEYRKGILGKDNQYKRYPGKLRNIVFYHHQ